MDLPAAFQQSIPIAAGSDPNPYPYPDSYPVVEASNNGHVHMGEAVAASFCLEEDMLALYEAFYPNSSTTISPNDHGPMAEYPSPPLPHPSGDTSGHQLAALQSLQAQQQFQSQQQNDYNWQEQHMDQHKHQHQQQQVLVPRKGSAIREKKKTEQLKTVYRVAADNILSVDKWAWRKYGQKPIKGSPYPRNYYRCSSSKGCTARKQVERSLTEPQMYVVTYTGDHFHPWPLHRNALAGISRSDHHRATAVSSHLPVPAADPRPPSEEPESEVLMIPNSKYVDEDMLRGMQELANSKLTSEAGPPTTRKSHHLLQQKPLYDTVTL